MPALKDLDLHLTQSRANTASPSVTQIVL